MIIYYPIAHTGDGILYITNTYVLTKNFTFFYKKCLIIRELRVIITT